VFVYIYFLNFSEESIHRWCWDLNTGKVEELNQCVYF